MNHDFEAGWSWVGGSCRILGVPVRGHESEQNPYGTLPGYVQGFVLVQQMVTFECRMVRQRHFTALFPLQEESW